MAAQKPATKVHDITYELVMSDNAKYRIKVPSNYKITYGKLHGSGSAPGGMQTNNVLRIYEAENKQRAIFHDVKTFRDIGLVLTKFEESNDPHEPGNWREVI